MKLVIVSTILFFVFIICFEAERFGLAYVSLGASLLAGCLAVFFGNKKAKVREKETNAP
ncbi:hypothetical protein G3N56_18210 [Desulfovibrio sulfodismutans]|uniref:Uncharacterized protein n=1 Tax=Desulfolutivibrio sulfodismutans TaxID=63561 RepID=A0A7K3NS51_9BACT|nr:hypothetical protein [Desulfolutivibrio sulfodismutans]NDY58673.1 hypothetical protein [Desulfolutivibrio sulfodismutans]